MKKIFFLTFLVFVFQIFIFPGSAFAAESSDKNSKNSDVLVTVNNQKITKTYVNKILTEEAALLPVEKRTPENLQALAAKIINQRIDEILISDAAKKAKLTVTNKEVKNSVDTIKAKFKTEKDFNEDLKKQGLTKTAFENEVKENLIRMKYISQELQNRTGNPSQDELENFYNNVISKMNRQDDESSAQKLTQEQTLPEDVVTAAANGLKRVYNEQAKVRQIFIKYSDSLTKEQKKQVNDKVKELKKELSAKNVNFSLLSVKYSDDAALRQKKGDIGYVLKEDLTPEVAKVIFSLDVGAYNKSPLKTGNGYHFFRVEEKKAQMPVEFDEIKQFLSDTLYKYNMQKEYDELLAELRASAKITGF